VKQELALAQINFGIDTRDEALKEKLKNINELNKSDAEIAEAKGPLGI
jgi:hypothetical protein